MPLTNWADWAVPKRLASSTASLIATRSGVSAYRISNAPETQHVAIGGGHPLQAPVVGRPGQQRVQLAAIAAHAGHQRTGELDQLSNRKRDCRNSSATPGFCAGIQIVLVEDLQGDFTCSTASGHSCTNNDGLEGRCTLANRPT